MSSSSSIHVTLRKEETYPIFSIFPKERVLEDSKTKAIPSSSYKILFYTNKYSEAVKEILTKEGFPDLKGKRVKLPSSSEEKCGDAVIEKIRKVYLNTLQKDGYEVHQE